MRRGLWILAAVLVLLLVGAAAWIYRDVAGVGRNVAPTTTEAPPESGADRAHPARKPTAEKAPVTDDETSSATIPPPVDLDAVDRERDLHGVVVRRDGTPIAGAEIVVLRRPWQRTDFLHVGEETVVLGPRTRSAVDGTFAIRLRRGERAQLRVAASGFPETTLREHQAGERVRIVLDAGVRLRVSVVDESNRVLSGVELEIVPSWSMRAADAAVERRITTGPDGDAVAEGLPARARVYVSVRSGGFGYPREHDVVDLGEGGETSLRLVMERGRPLRGRVVDDATGAPVAGARVGKGWLLACSVACDAEGRFVLPDWVDRGYDEIAAVAAGYARGEFVVGGQSEFELTLHRGFEAIGRIVDGQGRAVADALVEMVASIRKDDRQRTSVGDAVSGRDGRFHIVGLHPDMSHLLVVAASGFGRLRRPAPSKGGSSTVDLGDVVLPVPRLVAGVVLDSAGAPRPRVPVTIIGPRIEQPIPPEAPPGQVTEVFAPDDNDYGAEEEAVTDDLGRFAFADLAPGGYSIRAEAEGADDVTAKVDVPPDRDVTDVRLKVAGARKIEFHVVDAKGAPVAGVRADVHVPGRGPPLVARTDETGVARFDAPDAPAQYTIEIDGSRFATMGQNEFHDVPADGIVRVVVREAARLEGVVRDPDGKPVAGALLRLAIEGQREYIFHVDDAGTFDVSVPRGLATRVEVVGISHRHGESDEPNLVGSTQVVPPATGIVVVAERVAKDRTLTVLVTSPDSAAVAGETVLAQTVYQGSLGSAVTDAQGIAKFVGLPARPIVVGMGESAAWALPADAHVTPAGQQITLALRRASEIRGVVVDDAGKPAKCSIFAFIDEKVEGTASAGDDGHFVLRVPTDLPGPYKVEAQAENGPGDGAVDGVVPGGAEIRIVMAK